MRICYGLGRYPLTLDMGRCCNQQDLMDLCAAYMDNGVDLFLEFHPSLLLRLETAHAVELACEMVASYHNHVLQYEYDGVWAPPDATWVDSMCGGSVGCCDELGGGDTDLEHVMALSVVSQQARSCRARSWQGPTLQDLGAVASGCMSLRPSST